MQTATISTPTRQQESANVGLVANAVLSLAVGALLVGAPGTVAGATVSLDGRTGATQGLPARVSAELDPES